MKLISIFFFNQKMYGVNFNRIDNCHQCHVDFDNENNNNNNNSNNNKGFILVDLAWNSLYAFSVNYIDCGLLGTRRRGIEAI